MFQSRLLDAESPLLTYIQGCLENPNTLPAGLLFSGDGDVGQRILWREVLRYYLGPNIPDPETTAHPDIKLLTYEGSSGLGSLVHQESISVQLIRDSLDFISINPLRLKRRVLVLEGAELLTSAAANGLLKTIEEQGSLKSTLFLFTTWSPDAVLAPLKSRFQEIKLPPLSWEFLSNLPSPGSLEDKQRAFEGCNGDLAWYNYLLSPEGRAWEARGRRLVEGLLVGNYSTDEISSIVRALLGNKTDEEDSEDSSEVAPNDAVDPVLRLLYRFTISTMTMVDPDSKTYQKGLKLRQELSRLYKLKKYRFSLTWDAAIISTLYQI